MSFLESSADSDNVPGYRDTGCMVWFVQCNHNCNEASDESFEDIRVAKCRVRPGILKERDGICDGFYGLNINIDLLVITIL